MKNAILYIDDENENLESFRLAFWKFYDIVLSISTKDAEIKLSEREFELVISDQKMIDENGLDFIQRIKPQYPNIVFILLTAYSEMDVVIKAINLGVYRYIQKPWNYSEMKQAIDNAFEVFHLHKKNNQLLLELKTKNELLEKSNNDLVLNTKELRKSQKQLQTQNQKLELLNRKFAKALIEAKEGSRLKSAILANINHEIRTPMNGIIGFSEMLVKEEIPSLKMSSYAQIIKDSSLRLLKIIDNILAISRLEINQINIVEEPVCINEMLNELLFIYILQAKDKKIEIKLKRSLSDNDSAIITDKQLVIQIFNNLIENAIKFSANGEVEFGYTRAEKELCFYVKDSGVGIEKQKQKKVFESFYQVEMDSIRKFDGIGAGLHISKKICELLGGKIWLDSIPQVGSTFYFTVPYKKINVINHERIYSLR